jgi:hypothetical protein
VASASTSGPPGRAILPVYTSRSGPVYESHPWDREEVVADQSWNYNCAWVPAAGRVRGTAITPDIQRRRLDRLAPR